MLVPGERKAVVLAPPATRDSAVSPCFHGCPAFLHRHFPPQSPPSRTLYQSLRSQQQPSPWGFSTISKLQLPAAAPSRGPASLSGICVAVARTVWFSFRLGYHRSPVSLSALSVSSLTRELPPCGDQISASIPPPAEGRSSPTNTPVCPPSTFILPSFAWFCMFFSAGQVLLSALSWCSACISVSEGVFLMYPWKEMGSASTYSSSILFSSHTVYFN